VRARGRLSRPPSTTSRSDCRSKPLPEFAGIGQASLPAAPQAAGAETALPDSHDDDPHVQRPRRRVPQRPGLEPERFPWPSPSIHRLGTLYSPLHAGRLTTLTQASLTLQTARSLRPASHPTSRSRTGASLPGTQASPRTGLAPAGHRELIAPTSCGPPCRRGAGAVQAHAWESPMSRKLGTCVTSRVEGGAGGRAVKVVRPVGRSTLTALPSAR